MSPDWAAPTPSSAIEATVRIPGSKSITNRAFLLAGLAEGGTTVRHPLDSRDARLMLGALATLGADSESVSDGVRVRGGVLDVSSRASSVLDDTSRTPATRIDLGNAGTVARFVPPVAALGPRDVHFDGDEALHRRPIAPLLRALRDLGADVDGDGLPFTVRGRDSVRGGEVDLDSSASSQFLSALLLAAPGFERGVTVRLVSTPPSEPHVAMTLELLRTFGANPQRDGGEFHVPPGALSCAEYTVEPDLSSAAPFLAAAVLTGGRMRVPDWPSASTQPGDQLRELLGSLGAEVDVDATGLTITGPDGGFPGASLDLHEVGELTPVLAALLCFADGPSTISGVAHLRGHETDRLAALATELGGLGAQVAETADGLHITPARLHGGRFRTYDDHRLVMAAAVIGLRVPGIQIENPDTVGKTFPGFVDAWTRMLGT